MSKPPCCVCGKPSTCRVTYIGTSGMHEATRLCEECWREADQRVHAAWERVLAKMQSEHVKACRAAPAAARPERPGRGEES